MEQLTFDLFGEHGKACSACDIVKPLDDYSPDRRSRDGRQACCRECSNARQKRWTQENPEKRRKHNRDGYRRRKSKVAAYARANRQRINQKTRERRATLDDEARERHLARHRRLSAEYRSRNPELCGERNVEWRKANPDKAANIRHTRRARQHGNGSPEKFTRAEIGDRDGWMCGICEGPVDKTLRWPDQQCQSLDHIIPLALGGEHTRTNSRIAHWLCNVRRGVGIRKEAS
jgi:5-methylcytosine-specific restriction endonuclease McrA